MDTLRRRFWASETVAMTVLALVVGSAAALCAVAVVWAIGWLSALVSVSAASLSGTARFLVVLLPALGALAAGLLQRAARSEPACYDVTDITVAVAARHGRLSPRSAAGRALGAVAAIASGGSAGREGPIVHVGAALGSLVGQTLRLNDRRTVTLLAAGAAAGFAATFGAPLAGILFAIEVVLAGFAVQAFGALVVAAAAGAVMSRALLGQTPAFSVPVYSAAAPWELLLFAGLGLFAALAARLFSAAFNWIESTLDDWCAPGLVRLVAAGLAVGLLGYSSPAVLGMGFGGIEDALHGNLAFTTLLALALLKVLATALTVGSGAAGGMLAPLLFVGALAGAAYGRAAHAVFPSIGDAAGLYAVIGMAALVAAVMRAPLTAAFLVLEIGHDYRLAPALVVTCGAAIACAHLIEPSGLLARQLKRKGIEPRSSRDASLLQSILVEDAMTPAAGLPRVTPETDLATLARIFQDTGHHGIVILDGSGALYGIVTLFDVERAVGRGVSAATAADICTRNVVTVFPDETLDDALRHFAALDVGRLPVVARDDHTRLIGILRRSGIVRAYAQALVRTSTEAQPAGPAPLQAAVGAELAEFVLAEHDHAAGKRLRDIALPADCVVVSIHRRGVVVVPRGNVQLAPGDRLIILKISISVETLRALLRDGPSAADAAQSETATRTAEDRDPHV